MKSDFTINELYILLKSVKHNKGDLPQEKIIIIKKLNDLIDDYCNHNYKKVFSDSLGVYIDVCEKCSKQK